MKAAIAALLALATLGIPTEAWAQARWNPKAPENNQMLPAFNYAGVEAVLNAIGARHQRSGRVADKPALLVTFANNRKAVLMLGACNANGSACKSLSMQSTWTKIGNASNEETAAALHEFNREYSFGKAVFTSDGRPALQRYLTADYGYVRGNLAVNLLVFANQAERFAVEVLSPLERTR